MRDRTRFKISLELTRAIQRDTRSLTQLCAPYGLHQSSLSSILHGRTFTTPTRDRLIALGLSLGLAAEDCTRHVKAVRS